MESASCVSHARDDLEFDMTKFQPSTLPASAGSGFVPVWNPNTGFSSIAFVPGEFLSKSPSYDCYFDPNAAASYLDWPNTNSDFLNSPTTAAASDSSPFEDILSPTALANTSPTWNLDLAEKPSPFTMNDDAAISFISSRADMVPPVSPDNHGKPKSPRRKGKNSFCKSSSRIDMKSKSRSSVSSASSSSSIASARLSNSGHGGNHSITLRTASRKPKPSMKDEDRLSRESSPSSPDSNENLTFEERRARQNHNVVEKQYRNRLNAQFERLLAVLPANQTDIEGASRQGEFDDRRMSKAEVLDMARRRIYSLEEERRQLRVERETLLENVAMMQRAVQRQRMGIVGTAP